jgi:hypothetical protein
MSRQPECIMKGDGRDMFIIFNGVKIAKRGHPGTPKAKTWISLEPGYTVLDGDGEIVVVKNGVSVQ